MAGPEDVGSPWAIGSAEGGHKDILPELGTLEDFRALVKAARERGIEIALDIAFQCAPDHPYVSAHPEWFRHRPDGSVQYAENPPKKYQDIYPFDFETEDWRGLWTELKSVMRVLDRAGRADLPRRQSAHQGLCVLGMGDRGDQARASRRDVPGRGLHAAEGDAPPGQARLHAVVHLFHLAQHQDRTRPSISPSCPTGPAREYFRPNVWPNTPDILHETLQSGLRSVFCARLVLAATLSANYGIYGPAYELMESTPREPGSEEYLDSEKYQLRHWDLDRPDSLWPLIARVNRIRRENAALQSDATLSFCTIDNEQLIAYMKT